MILWAGPPLVVRPMSIAVDTWGYTPTATQYIDIGDRLLEIWWRCYEDGPAKLFFISLFIHLATYYRDWRKTSQEVSCSVCITSQLPAWDWLWQLKVQELETLSLAYLASLCAFLFNCLGILQNSVGWEAELFTISATVGLILQCANFFIGFSSLKVFTSCSRSKNIKNCTYVVGELSSPG